MPEAPKGMGYYLTGNSRTNPTMVEHSEWKAEGVNYYNASYNPENNRYETSTVWHKWCRWRCISDGTRDEPGKGYGWKLNAFISEMVLGLTATGSDGALGYIGQPIVIHMELRVRGSWESISIHDWDKLPVRWSWKRVTRGGTATDQQKDAVWNSLHEKAVPWKLTVTDEDLRNASGNLNNMIFRLTGTLVCKDIADDGQTEIPERGYVAVRDSNGLTLVDCSGSPLFTEERPGEDNNIKMEFLIKV